MKMAKMIIGLMMTASTVSNAEVVVDKKQQIIVGTSYVSTFRYSQPLTGVDICRGPNTAQLDNQIVQAQREDEGTWAGQQAYNLAASEALASCKNDYNSDCKIVSARYKDIISTEFIGYKACEAKVLVHGYKLK